MLRVFTQTYNIFDARLAFVVNCWLLVVICHLKKSFLIAQVFVSGGGDNSTAMGTIEKANL